MAGQGPSRRELLHAIALASAASAFGGFSMWKSAFAEEGEHHEHIPAKLVGAHTPYRPVYFSLPAYRTLETLTALILPATFDAARNGGPSIKRAGAKEAGVAEFIDFTVKNDLQLQPQFQQGLKWLDQADDSHAAFLYLTPAQQIAILDRIAYSKQFRPAEKEGQSFFILMRRYTVMGFYTSRLGLEALDYPGLTFYGTSPGCIHEGNPEHAGLS